MGNNETLADRPLRSIPFLIQSAASMLFKLPLKELGAMMMCNFLFCMAGGIRVPIYSGNVNKNTKYLSIPLEKY